MLVVTARADEGPAGCLVGFSTQCSIDPPRYLMCLSVKNRTQRVASNSNVVAVHFLEPQAMELARLFGEETTDESDTFSRCRWHSVRSGYRSSTNADGGSWGTILEQRPFGDHVGFLLGPIAAQNQGREQSLLYHQVKDLDPGHQP